MAMTGNTSLIISIICAVFLLVLSCQTKRKHDNNPLPTLSPSDSLIKETTVIKPDPIILSALDTVSIFNQALKNKGKSYHHENDTIEISYGYILSKKQKHLFVKLKNVAEYKMEFRIYAIKNEMFSLILYVAPRLPNTDAYALLDVNNDHYKDFVFIWHADNGCSSCRYCDIFLLKHNSLHFTEAMTFSEPIFYFKNKIIFERLYDYGMTYSKFKWNNKYSVDTIEYIYPPYANTIGAYFLSDSTHYNKVDHTKNKKIVLLDIIPIEYSNYEREQERQKSLFKWQKP